MLCSDKGSMVQAQYFFWMDWVSYGMACLFDCFVPTWHMKEGATSIVCGY